MWYFFSITYKCMIMNTFTTNSYIIQLTLYFIYKVNTIFNSQLLYIRSESKRVLSDFSMKKKKEPVHIHPSNHLGKFGLYNN